MREIMNWVGMLILPVMMFSVAFWVLFDMIRDTIREFRGRK